MDGFIISTIIYEVYYEQDYVLDDGLNCHYTRSQ